MDAELKQEWINRLLSDDYHQGVGVLRREHNGTIYNCCWGVLADILFEQNKLERRPDSVDPNVSRYESDPLWMVALPSYQLLDKVGIPWNAGPSADIRNYLAGLNDGGSNFIYIAGEIEQYVPVA